MKNPQRFRFALGAALLLAVGLNPGVSARLPGLDEVVVEIQRVRQEVRIIDQKLEGVDEDDDTRQRIALREKREELLRELVPLLYEAHVRKAPGYTVDGVFNKVREVSDDAPDGGEGFGTLLVGFAEALIERRKNESLMQWKFRVLESARKVRAALDVAMLSLHHEVAAGMHAQALKTQRAILGLYEEVGDLYPFDEAGEELAALLLRLHQGTLSPAKRSPEAEKKDWLLMADLGRTVTRILHPEDPRQIPARLVMIRAQKALGRAARAMDQAHWVTERLPAAAPAALARGLDLRDAVALSLETDLALARSEGKPVAALKPLDLGRADDAGGRERLEPELERWVGFLERVRDSELPWARSVRAEASFADRLARHALEAARLLVSRGHAVRATGLLSGLAAAAGPPGDEARGFLEGSAKRTRDPALSYLAYQALLDGWASAGPAFAARAEGLREAAAKRFLAAHRGLFKKERWDEVLKGDEIFQRRFSKSSIRATWTAMLRIVALRLEGTPGAEPYYTEILNSARKDGELEAALKYRALARERLFDFDGAARDYRSLLIDAEQGRAPNPEVLERALLMAWLAGNPAALPTLFADLRVCGGARAQACEYYDALKEAGEAPGSVGAGKGKDALAKGFSSRTGSAAAPVWLLLALERGGLPPGDRVKALSKLATNFGALSSPVRMGFAGRVASAVDQSLGGFREHLRNSMPVTGTVSGLEERSLALDSVDTALETLLELPWMGMRKRVLAEVAAMHGDFADEIDATAGTDAFEATAQLLREHHFKRAALLGRESRAVAAEVSRHSDLEEAMSGVLSKVRRPAAAGKGQQAASIRRMRVPINAEVLHRVFPDAGWRSLGRAPHEPGRHARYRWQEEVAKSRLHRAEYILSAARERKLLPESELLAMSAVQLSVLGAEEDSLLLLAELRRGSEGRSKDYLTTLIFNQFLAGLSDEELVSLFARSGN
ncbi:MAG: hypothetical protein IT285_03210 [Bdellovibrionales bacterium]|nr:hypothetical protein [Bdellovibrionales bacterium]